ncbi:MAG: PEP-CTERM sorting domain-containing protein [Rubrivivax sp.]
MSLRFPAALLALALCQANAATVVLYDQNFENPTGFVNDNGDVNAFRTVNQLYGGQPAGFQFAQTFTVETLLVGGAQAWGTGFLDPQARAGQYALGMLSSVQNDLLGLSFNVSAYQFLNFQLDISSIDLDRWGGPFVPTGGLAPTFRISLYDNPTGATGLGGGTLLDTIDVSGLLSSSRNTFNWSKHTLALDATGNTNGNVTLLIDLLAGGYAAMDNFRIAASDTAGDTGGGGNGGGGGSVPEPGTPVLAGLGLVALALVSRRATAARGRAAATAA